MLYHLCHASGCRRVKDLLTLLWMPVTYKWGTSAPYPDERRNHDHVTIINNHLGVWDVHVLHSSQGNCYSWITTVYTTSLVKLDFTRRSLRCFINPSGDRDLVDSYQSLSFEWQYNFIYLTLYEGWTSALPTLFILPFMRVGLQRYQLYKWSSSIQDPPFPGYYANDRLKNWRSL